MMHGREKSDHVIVAMKPANKAKEAHCVDVCGSRRSGVGGAKGAGQGEYAPAKHVLDSEPGSRGKCAEAHTVTFAVKTRGRSRMRESRTYGSGRGACDETHVPTATAARPHHLARRRSGGMARRGARAAALDAGDRLSKREIARDTAHLVNAFRRGLKKIGYRGPKRRRIPMGIW